MRQRPKSGNAVFLQAAIPDDRKSISCDTWGGVNRIIDLRPPMYQSALNVLGDVKCAIEPIRNEAYQIVGPNNQIGISVRTEPIVQYFAL